MIFLNLFIMRITLLQRIIFILIAVLLIAGVSFQRYSFAPLQSDACREGEVSIQDTCVVQISDRSDIFQRTIPDNIVDGFTDKGYYAYVSQRNIPWLILVPDTAGITEEVQFYARLFALEGYNVFVTNAWSGSIVDSMSFIIEDLQKVQWSSDVSIVWWWIGGEQAIEASLLNEFDSTINYYGDVYLDIEQIQQLHGPMLSIFASQNTSQSEEELHLWYDSMLENERSVFVQFYDEEPGFMFSDSGVYGNISTIDAYELTLSFLRGIYKE